MEGVLFLSHEGNIDLILEKMANGQTIDQLLTAYPHLTKDAVLACFRYAAESIKSDKIYPLAS
ncbi:MAG: DUF433 domain-containing protein [Bacteroidota bacterium]